MKRNRLEYNPDEWPAFIAMHVVFFLVQFFFYYVMNAPTSFSTSNIPVIYYRVQVIGYPTVLICSLLWMNAVWFPGKLKHAVISECLFVLEWFYLNRLLVGL